MKNFKKLMLVILLSNMMIFAEDDWNFPDRNHTASQASSVFSPQQLPVSVLFVNASLTYSQPIIRMFCFMYAIVAESSYSRMMSFSSWGQTASMKRSKAVFSLSDMDAEQKDNVLRIILPEDTRPFSPCLDDGQQSHYFIGSPKLQGKVNVLSITLT